jgi:hypothetical protein
MELPNNQQIFLQQQYLQATKSIKIPKNVYFIITRNITYSAIDYINICCK